MDGGAGVGGRGAGVGVRGPRAGPLYSAAPVTRLGRSKGRRAHRKEEAEEKSTKNPTAKIANGPNAREANCRAAPENPDSIFMGTII